MLPVNQELVRRWCTITVQNAIRGWKNKNKRKYYKKWKLFSPQERDQIKLERITRIEWESFFEYLEKPEKMEEAKRNGDNVKKKKLCHCLGQRSFAQTKRKLKSEGDGEFEIFIKSHKKKLGVGAYANDKTEKICEEIIKRKEELEGQMNGVDSSAVSRKLTLSSILDDVAGKHHGGYERGYGSGYLTRQMRQSRSSYNHESSASNSYLSDELKVANQLIKDMKDDYQRMAEEREREKAQERAERDEMRRELAEFKSIFGSFRQNHNNER